jgi:spore coat polysaccharide biosynthesis protein SpsF
MNIMAIIQARTGSTRLPGKVLKDIEGKPMLVRVIERVQRARLPHSVVVATSTKPADDAIAGICHENHVLVFRGNELDVLDRYYQAASQYNADVIVRITSDCPLIDPEILDRVVKTFLEKRPDYATNSLVRTYPRGLDVEVVAITALEMAWREAREPYQRVHVMPYFYQNPERFCCLNVAADRDYSNYRWTVDTSADLEFVRAVYSCMVNAGSFGWVDVIALLNREPELADINREVLQKSLEEG